MNPAELFEDVFNQTVTRLREQAAQLREELADDPLEDEFAEGGPDDAGTAPGGSR